MIEGNFVGTFTDYETLRCLDVYPIVVSNKDVEFLRGMLLRQTPKFRAFIIQSAQLICEAGANADTEAD